MRYPRKRYGLLSERKPAILYPKGHENLKIAPTNVKVVAFPSSKYYAKQIQRVASEFQLGVWLIKRTDIPKSLIDTAHFFENHYDFREWLSKEHR